MGYIKKLKNNELVGGTDKTTIYPVTSTEAVFEEIANGNESSFKSQKTINKEQQDTLDDHEERIQAAEAEDIKSITINGSTKKFEVDDENNVDLTIYTVDNDPEMPSIASNVEDLRNMVGTSTPVLKTSHKTRIETLEGGESVTGSVENKIKTKVDSINSSYQDDNNEYVKYSMTQASGEVTNFNIDETNLKNAITSLNTSISGDNIVIRSGSTPSGTGEAGKIYRYVNSSNNTYTDYMYSGGSWVTLATHDTSNEQAQVAYYTCTATGSGAQATKQFVGNGSLTYTPSSGGHIKILMGEANTATGTIYLQFGTTTSTKKPLYYNGESVSPTNTWDAGEVISVYYDGTYYQASNAQGGSNRKIDAYLLGDLRTLAVGQTYEKDEAVKTTDKQFRRITKSIKTLSLSETLISGDIKVNSSKTYRVASAVNTFNPSTTYIAGAYALGSMTVYTLTVSADTVTAGNITVNGTEVAIESTDDAAAIATKIASALIIDGWTDSASENVVTVRCNTIGNNTTTITITDTDNTGVTVASSSVAGTSVIRKYDVETWTNASVSGMVTDGILVEVDVAWLITNATQQNSVTQDIDAATTYWEDINIASIANSYVGMYYASNNWRWQNSQNNNYGKFVSIEPGRKYKMVGGTVETNYALLKNNTHATGNITNFATGETGRTLTANATVIITPPADAKYLYFRTNSNGGLNRTPQSLSVLHNFHDLKESYDERFETIGENLETLDEAIKDNGAAIKSINDFPDIVLTGEESVDIASLEEQNCSLGGSGKWYYSSPAGKHKAIEVEPDSIIGIKVSGFNYGYYGWVTSSYNPPYQNNNTIPYAVGTGRTQLSKKDNYTYLRVPINAKYLIVCTVDGGGVRVSWEVANCTYKYRHNNFTKFRFAHWNIGHFSGYDGTHATFNPTITPENAAAMARRYKQVINDVGADILGIAEYDPNFTTDGQKAKDVIFQCYNKIIEGTKRDYNCNTIMFNGIKYINNYEILYTSRNQPRYIKLVNAEIGGRPIYIVETHWDFDTAANKRSQATQLLNLVKDCEYVIIGGDLNVYDTVPGHSQREEDAVTLQMFKDAGFEFANNGYLDAFTTSGVSSVDHIMTKGFAMSNRQRVDMSGTLSDHYAIYCDLVMKI